jgi:cytochrome P450
MPTLGLFDMLRVRHDVYTAQIQSPLRHADVVRIKILNRTLYVVHNPDMAQQVLQRSNDNYTKDEGYKALALLFGNGLITNTNAESWRKHRKILQPPFHRESLQQVCTIATQTTEKLLAEWKAKEGGTINFTHSMARLTLEIICKALFTADVSQVQIEMVWRNLNFLNEVCAELASNPWHQPWNFPVPRHIKARKYLAEIDEMIHGLIQRRKQTQNPPHDLLQTLIDARYDDGNPLSDEQIRDEVMTVFVAGHETTVNAMSWTWYLLKKNPAAEEKLHEENTRFENNTPVFADIPQLRYGWCVMNEAMRIYPPVTAVGREALADEQVGHLRVKKGEQVVINIAGLHHHPAHWKSPETFIPGRFMDFDLKGHNRFLFMPFGGGPRICIGNNFAMLEMQIINSLLSARVQMDLLSTYVKPKTLITLKPAEGIMMRIVKVSLP